MFKYLIYLISSTGIFLTVYMILKYFYSLKYSELKTVRDYYSVIGKLKQLKEETQLANVEANLILQSTKEKISGQKALLEELKVRGEKEARLEFEKSLANHKLDLEKEKQQLYWDSGIVELEKRIADATQILENRKKALKHTDEKTQEKRKEVDFINSHTINFNISDKEDIEIIRSLTNKLRRRDALNKLIWTEFYQKPLQKLCKELKVKNVSGIYKITSLKTEAVYIGKSTDIDNRWKQHVKAALGIGTTRNQSNLLYKTMNEEGPENFTFEVIGEYSSEELDAQERYWIEFYDSTSFGLNTKIGG